MSEENDKALVITRPTTNGNGLFKGPLGLWPWPVVNLLMVIVNKLTGKNGTGEVTRAARTKITELRPTQEGGWSILEHEV